MHVNNVESLRVTFTAYISFNPKMNKALGSVFCLITFCEHRFIFSRQIISTSKSQRPEEGAIEFNIVVCRLTITLDIMPNLFNLFRVCKQKDWVIVSIMSSDNDGNRENG